VSYVPIPSDPGALVLRADGSRVEASDYEQPVETIEPANDPRAEIEALLRGLRGQAGEVNQ
jgi:hypothetical protein